ncbi:hypothetical protein ACFL38_03905 [Candidatus Omnitrophota bacterium]
MKILSCVIMFVLLANVCYGQQDSPEATQTAPGSSAVVHNLQKWDVKTQADSVDAALAVFERKSQPRYNKQLWLVDKNDSTKTILVQYTTGRETDRILFSPNEDFLYYVGLSPAGISTVYGMNLVTSEEFMLDNGVDVDFFTCPNNQTQYIIVQKQGEQQAAYHIYNQSREKINVLSEGVNMDNLAHHICY